MSSACTYCLKDSTPELSTTSSYESKSVGMRAETAYKKSAEVFCETPFIFVPNVFKLPSSIISIIRASDSCPLNPALVKAGCKELEYFMVCQLLLRAKGTDQLGQAARHLLDTMPVGPLYVEKKGHAEYLGLIAKVASSTVAQVSSALAKVATNSFAVTASLVPSSLGIALYERAVFVAHSCSPNLSVYFKRDGSVVFVADRDIAAGEKLTWCALRHMSHLGVHQRREGIRRILYFTCTCERCTSEEQSTSTASAAQAPSQDMTDSTMLTAVLKFEEAANEGFLAKHTTTRLTIDKKYFSDASAIADFFKNTFGFVPSDPSACRLTCVLVFLINWIGGVLSDLSLFSVKQRLMSVAYSVFLNEDELLHLPACVSSELLLRSLSLAATSHEPFCGGYAALVQRLVRADQVDHGTMMCIQGFAANLLRDELQPSRCSIDQQLREARSVCPSAYFDVDFLCAPAVLAIATANQAALDKFLQGCRNKKKKQRKKQKQKQKGDAQLSNTTEDSASTAGTKSSSDAESASIIEQADVADLEDDI